MPRKQQPAIPPANAPVEAPVNTHPTDYPAIPTEQQKEDPTLAYRRRVRLRRAHLAKHITQETLHYLEEEFQTNLPCYQTRDPYTRQPLEPNPISAAIRDGQREVLLWLRHEIAMHQTEHPNTDT